MSEKGFVRCAGDGDFAGAADKLVKLIVFYLQPTISIDLS